MRLITRPLRVPHPSQDCVDEFDAVILADPHVRPAAWDGGFQTAAFLAASALFKFGGDPGLRAAPVLPRGLLNPSRFPRLNQAHFAVLMGPQFAKCVPHFLLPGPRAIYLMDVWPSVQDRVVAFIRAFSVDYVFVSSSQSADYVRERVGASVHWVPEGIDPTPYRSRPPAERDIDVLEMGRRSDAYHAQIAEPLERAGRVHGFERVKGELVFPTREGLLDGLSRSTVSVCFPSNLTHPKHSGDVETMTLRYLQSMASRCVVVGHAPAEMVRLFGYNPVVEIDPADPAGQLLGILDAPERYADLVERNERAVLGSHTWSHRWHQIAGVLFDR